MITFKDLNNIECKGKTISCAGKGTGKYRSCYNIEYQNPSTLSGTKTWIDINNVHDIQRTNNGTERDNQKETTKIALSNNRIKEIYENIHLCFEQAKLKEFKSVKI